MRFVSENDILNFPIINYQDQKIRIDIDNSWHTYSNLAYKNVKIQNRNHEPHTDGFTLGCNLFLTHNGVGTSLFKKKYDTAKERLENDVKEITELIQDREGAYNDYQDASALKYSHVQATARFKYCNNNTIVLSMNSLHDYLCYFMFLHFNFNFFC